MLANAYRKEAIALNIRSPFRQSVYIAARIKGRTEGQSKAEATVTRR
jgi:hypothetical protein